MELSAQEICTGTQRHLYPERCRGSGEDCSTRNLHCFVSCLPRLLSKKVRLPNTHHRPCTTGRRSEPREQEVIITIAPFRINQRRYHQISMVRIVDRLRKQWSVDSPEKLPYSGSHAGIGSQFLAGRFVVNFFIRNRFVRFYPANVRRIFVL